MRTAVISVSIEEKKFKTEFAINQETPEYKVADEAFYLAMLFAKSQILATYGYMISDYEVAKFLEKLDYNYEIREEINQ